MQLKFLSTAHIDPPIFDIQVCYVHIYFPYKKFRSSPSWQKEKQALYSSRSQTSRLGPLQVGPLNIWKCVHILFYHSVCGPTLRQLKQDSATLGLKFTRMAQNIVTQSPSRYTRLYTPVVHYFHLSFSLFQTHINMLSDSHMAFFLIRK
jgi:hypothetical protein